MRGTAKMLRTLEDGRVVSVVADLVIEDYEFGDGFVIDLHGPLNDIILSGKTIKAVVDDVMDELCWETDRAITTDDGKFPEYKGVTFTIHEAGGPWINTWSGSEQAEERATA